MFPFVYRCILKNFINIMTSYLPSEIGRLIYGYLQENCSEDVALRFLNTCKSMRECQSRIRCGFDSKFQNQFSLTQILKQYSILSELIFRNVSVGDGTKCSHFNIVYLLRKLLESRLNHMAKFQPIRERSTNVKNVLSADRSNFIPTSVNHVVMNPDTNDDESIPKNRIDGFKRMGVCNDLKVHTYRNSSLSMDSILSVEDNFSAQEETHSIQGLPMWDHSVQNILAEYSPVINAGRKPSDDSTCDQKRAPNMKRKREETVLEIVNIQKNQKRTKLDRNNRKSGDQRVMINVSKTVPMQNLTCANDNFIQREISDEIELYFNFEANNN